MGMVDLPASSAHLLVYNLVRKVAAQAAWEHDLASRQISFASAQQSLEAFSAAIAASKTDERAWLCNVPLLAIAAHRIDNRPKRIEPRRLKRRYDRYPFLTVPREQAREVMLNGRD